MTERKNFNYKTATVQEVVDQFKRSTAQAIYAVRNSWKDDDEMSAKIEKAYFEYKIAKVLEKHTC